MELGKYIDEYVPKKKRKAFAKACGTTVYYMNMLRCGAKPVTPRMAVAIEKATGGKVTCEEVCPDFDWAYLRRSVANDPHHGADAPATNAARAA